MTELPSETAIVAFLEKRGKEAVTQRELVDAFSVHADLRRDFRDLLQSLVDDGRVVRLKSKLFRAKLPEVSARPPWMSERDQHDGRRRGGQAGHQSAPRGGRGGRPEPGGKASATRSLGIEPTQLVGVLEHIGGKAMAVLSRDEDLQYLPITGDFTGLERRQAAVFELHEGKQKRSAQLVQVLGNPDAPRVEVLRLALSRGFRATFSAEAQSQATSFRAPGGHDLEDGRRDLRSLPFVTIDGEDAKDFDDAVYVRREGGGFRLFVAIADVSHYVRQKSALDRDGFQRGTSVYFPGFVLPMLPPSLSDDLCSLRPQVERLAFVAEMHVDADGHVSDESSYRALFRSSARLTYTQVEAALHKGEDNVARAVGEPLHVFALCARALRAAKSKRGAVDLDLDEPQIVLGADGLPLASVARARLESHRLIEDAMLAANSCIAREMHKRGLPCPYRVHERPNDDKLSILRQASESFGYRHPLPDRPSAAQVARFVRAIANEPKGRILLPLVLRAMSRARYSAERLGHFALAEPDYLHFTSPIRRFPDLLVHRSLGSTGKDAPADMERAAMWLSEREQAAERCSRDVSDMYRCMLAAPLVGSELEAVVTGALDFGVFVQVAEPYVEGLIPVRTIGDDYYALDGLGLRLTGKRNGRSIGVGDTIRVRIKEVRMQKRQIEFEWVQTGKAKGNDRPAHLARGDAASATAEAAPMPAPATSGAAGAGFLERAREKFAAGAIGRKPQHGHGGHAGGRGGGRSDDQRGGHGDHGRGGPHKRARKHKR